MGWVMEFARGYWRAIRGLVLAPPPMTYDQFLAALRATPRTWQVLKKGRVPMWIRFEEGGCPLTKVCEQVTGRLYSTSRYMAAAERMGLPKSIARKVWRAADNWRMQDPGVRRDLLVATGLLTDPLDAALAKLIAEGVPAEPAGKELVAV